MFQNIIKYILISITLFSVVIMVNWVFFDEKLFVFAAQESNTKFNTAFLFLLSSVGLILYDSISYRNLTRISGVAVSLFSLITLLQYPFHIDLGIDHLFVTDTFSSITPGRMSPVTSFCFFLLGVVISFGNEDYFRLKRVIQLIQILIFSLSVINFFSYLLKIPIEKKLFIFQTMSGTTSILFCFLVVSTIYSFKNSNYHLIFQSKLKGSRLFISVIPFITIIPLLLIYGVFYLIENKGVDIHFGLLVFATTYLVIGFINFSKLAYDLNKSEREANKLTKTIKKYKEAIDQTSIVTITNARGKITFVNDLFCEISQYSRNELLGQTHKVINSGHHSKEFFKDLWRTIASGKVWSGKIKNRAKDGSFYWVQTTIIPFFDDQGKIMEYLSIRNNITEAVNHEILQKKHLKTLKKHNKETRRYVYILSHDLNEPLVTIKGASQLLLDLNKNNPDPNQIKLFQFIRQSAENLSNKIKNIVDYSKIGLSLKPAEINTQKLVNSILSDLENETKQSQAQIYVEKLPSIMGQPEQIKQLFYSIIINAIKFRKEGVPPEIHIKGIENDHWYTFSVVDNGIGVQKEYQEKIFDIFQREHLKEQFKGNGLGLANCKKIVEIHDGEIWVEKNEMKGSTFFFTIRK